MSNGAISLMVAGTVRFRTLPGGSSAFAIPRGCVRAPSGCMPSIWMPHGRFSDMPGEFLEVLIRDLAAERLGTQAIVLVVSDRTEPMISNPLAKLKVTGGAVDIARWLAGHEPGNLESEGAALPAMDRRLPAFL